MNTTNKSTGLSISSESIQGGLILLINGELDASSSLDFDSHLKDLIGQGHKQFIFDGKGLAYIASAGLGVFISNKDDVYDQGGQFIFCNLSDNVLNVFSLLGLTDLFTFVPSKEEALDLIS
jgi:anti-sigma B factor antagonist